MPNDIQNEIRTKCGDIFIKYRNGSVASLPKTCDIIIDPNIAKSVVEALRNDESLKKDLRYLIGNESGKLNEIKIIQEQINYLIPQLENVNND